MIFEFRKAETGKECVLSARSSSLCVPPHSTVHPFVVSAHNWLLWLWKQRNDAPNWKHKLTFLNAIPLFTILHGFTFPCINSFAYKQKTVLLRFFYFLYKRIWKKREDSSCLYWNRSGEFKKTEPHEMVTVNEGVEVHWPFESDVLDSLLCKIEKCRVLGTLNAVFLSHWKRNISEF